MIIFYVDYKANEGTMYMSLEANGRVHDTGQKTFNEYIEEEVGVSTLRPLLRSRVPDTGHACIVHSGQSKGGGSSSWVLRTGITGLLT